MAPCRCMATGRHAPAPAYRAVPFAPSWLPTLQPSRCVHCRHADCVRELLEAGASPLPANMQGATALHYAAARGQAACIRLLLSAPVRLPGAPAGLHALSMDDVQSPRISKLSSQHCIRHDTADVTRARLSLCPSCVLQRAAAAGQQMHSCRM